MPKPNKHTPSPSNPRSAINISINARHPRVPNLWRGCKRRRARSGRTDGEREAGREKEKRTGREWWGGTPVNRYKISSAIFPGKFSAAIVKRRPPPPRVFIAKSICETRVRGQECRCCESLYPRWNARSAHSGHRRRLLRGGPAGWGKQARAVVGRGDDPSALSAYHRVFVGLVRYATAWSETTRRTRFETSFAKRPPPGWSRGEGGGKGEGGEGRGQRWIILPQPRLTEPGPGVVDEKGERKRRISFSRAYVRRGTMTMTIQPFRYGGGEEGLLVVV